jgi:hypothetical protein
VPFRRIRPASLGATGSARNALGTFQLELIAFRPFIEPLDSAQREEERVIMTRKMFGQIRALPEADEEKHSNQSPRR